MKPFDTLDAIAVPLDRVNVDTDQIVPARFLRRPRDQGYGPFLFHDVREKDEAFALDRGPYEGAQILVAAENFGCGSSREGAVWALAGTGLRAWIAPSFGDIFLENSFKNGCPAIVLPAARVAAIRASLAASPGQQLRIDLAAQTVQWAGGVEHFEVDAFRKECLLRGMDEIDLTLQHGDALDAHERRQREETPWLAAS
jgi:3-isopropylmalate/(R)-2-methylmalate dehydratase small subunit